MDLTELKARIDRAVEEMKAPPPPEGKTVLPVSENLHDEDQSLIWDAVGEIRRKHGEVFVLFAEPVLASLVIDVLAELDEAPSLKELSEALAELARSERPWLISTPLANIALPQPVIQVAEDAVLQRTYRSADWLEGDR